MTESEKKEFYGSMAWRNLRDYVIAKQPLCVECKKKGLLTVGYIVDHIEPVDEAWSKRFDDRNLQVLCHSCHNKKHFAGVQKKELKLLNKRWKT